MNLFNRKKELVISNNIIAIDRKVIARKGERLEQALLHRVAELHPQGIEDKQTLGQTRLLSHFQTLLDKNKYRFVANDNQKRQRLVDILAGVRLNKVVFKELAWMTRYQYHYFHTLAVTLIVTRIALDLFRDETKAREAACCTLTHDFGITRVPERILKKISRLDDEEVKIVCEHPIYSYILLTYYFGSYQKLNVLIGYEHHEDLLGTGYPRGIVQEYVISQLIRICDFYDALISARPFRPALSRDEALDVIAEEVNRGRLNSEAFALLNSYLGNSKAMQSPTRFTRNRELLQGEKHRVYKRITG